LRVQACSRRTLDAFGRALAGAFLIGLVDLFIVGDPWRETQPGARPCHHVYERLPHREDRRRLAAEQLAGLVDCGVGVGGSILGDQDHVVHSSRRRFARQATDRFATALEHSPRRQ
jgi:hypothetical protein